LHPLLLLLRQVYLVEFIVRQATRNDFRAIRSLIHTVQINPTGLDWKRFLVVMTNDGNLMGCGQIKVHRDRSREMASIAVQERFRGLGIARAVIVALLAIESKRPLFLMCRSHLKQFYAKFGFHAIELVEMPPYFWRISRIERIINSKEQPDNRLVVMRLD
jgi:N-acetylglutamate synthase-like GNAT family acetyltransferase